MSDQDNFYVVGIGASAGGFEALTKFFRHLPANTGAAFVVIQHLSPSYESQSHKLLGHATKMPVEKVSGETKLEADHIYVIPEGKKLKLNQEGLYLEERGSDKAPNLVIDTFFDSLAYYKKEKAIGIVLSGTGSDGARGVQSIKGGGGLVMVQSPQSASFDSMPNVSISSDHPDYINPPEELAKDLSDYLKNPELLDKESLRKERADKHQNTLNEIIHHISSFSGVNFSNYKPGTIIRRIEKRMKINHLNSLRDYDSFLKKHPKEVRHIFDDLLIGVTRFFRDNEAFDSLREKVIPKLCRERNLYEPVRIWISGCSTGEEAYSLAMLFDEYIVGQNINIDFKIFATDINQRAIDIASSGRYSNAIEGDVSPERLHRYFNPAGEFYEVKKELRRRIIFSKHNLLNDPPFIRIDLISCRNLFIYLNDEVQNKVLHNFNYSLHQDGYLFLGVNESNNEQEKLFECIDIRNKIFRNKGNGASRPFRPVNHFFHDMLGKHETLPDNNRRHITTVAEERYADLVVERFAPPSIVVNHHEDVVYTAGNVQKYLQFPNRRSDLNVYNMLHGNLLLTFRNGLRQIQEGKSRILFADTLIGNHEDPFLADVVFSRIDKQQQDRRDFLILVEFHDKDTKPGQEQPEVIRRDKYSQVEIENLEMELKLARRELRFTSDELETINEELQSSNEEMQSANEELQSTNEELQSSNEELQTVNTELKNKIDTITILHDDMLNLFNSTQIATIFLDSGLNIRKFTPPATAYFNIRETDIGRPIGHYSYNFKYHSLEKDIKQVLKTLQPVEQEVEHQEGHYSIMRVLPYKTENLQIKGVVVTFTDITELKLKNNKLKKITEELRTNEQYLKSLLDNTPDLIARFDRKLNCIFVNKAMQEVETSGAAKDQPLLKNSAEMFPLLQEVLQSGKVHNFYFSSPGLTLTRHYYTRLIPELNKEKQEVESILAISTDITDLKTAERKIVMNNAQLSEMYDRMDNFVHAIAHDMRAPIVNLKMLSDLVLEENDRQQQELYVQEISHAVQKLDNTLGGLIQIIEMENEHELVIEELNFEKIFREIITEFKGKIAKEKVQFETDFSNGQSIVFVRVYLESILKNLISNAIKYSLPNRPPLIRISTKSHGNFMLLTIQDNGRGINLEEHGHKLFKPFKRLHKDTEGMGVGLYVIKYMVAKNGGRIEVDSKVKEGTTFRIFLKPYEKSRNFVG